MWIWLFADTNGNPDAAKKPGKGAENAKKAKRDDDDDFDDDDDDDDDDDEYVSVGDEVNTTLTILIPWAISILFHFAIILLAFFIVWSTITKEDEEKIIVPIARLSEQPGAPLTMTEQTEVTEQSQPQAMTTPTTPTAKASKSVSSLADMSTNQLKVVGAAGSAGGGKLTPFGAGAVGASSFKARFFGTGGNAKTLAYLVDASGSLIDTLPFVIQELKRSINNLSPKQKFTIIFFQRDEALEVPPPGLKRANDQLKKTVTEWIGAGAGNVIAGGTSNPVPALRRALGYKPDLIFVLSDNLTGYGRYEIDQDRLVDMINQMNKRNTKINTIQFLYPDALATLKRISTETQGVYKFIGEADLGLK